ncbi:MAG: hypothetical protein ABI742_11365 [Gemmatimonadota bacterium]
MPRLSVFVTTALGGLVVLSAACSDSSGPSKPKGMTGTWAVSVATFDESAAGRATCHVSPTFSMTIDSTAQGTGVALSTGTSSESLICTSGDIFTLTVQDSLASVLLSGGIDPQHAVVWQVGSSTSEFLALTWPDMGGDSIGGIVINVDTVGSVELGQSIWKALRQ